MSVWSSGGANGFGGMSVGGSSGHGLGGQVSWGGGGWVGGDGGSTGTTSGGSVNVQGGVRDRDTAQCIATSGGACPVSADYLSCLKGNCGGNLALCYQFSGATSGASGPCADYATCMLTCSCDGSRSACENQCLQSYILGDYTCASCLGGVSTCASIFGCQLTETCTGGGYAGSTGGYYGNDGAGGAAGSPAHWGGAGGAVAWPYPVDAAPPIRILPPDAGPSFPLPVDPPYFRTETGPIIIPLGPPDTGGFMVDAVPLRGEVALPAFPPDVLPYFP
jgi:hypothetical protein